MEQLNLNRVYNQLTLFGSYNKNSIGDKIILVSLLDLIFRTLPEVKISLLTFNFDDKLSLIKEIEPYNWSKNVEVNSIYKKQIQNSGVSTKDNRIILKSTLKNIVSKVFPRALYEKIKYIINITKFVTALPSNLERDSKGLIIGGGNLLMDLFPIWPIILYFITSQFKKAELPIIIAGVGAFPINTFIGKVLLRNIVSSASQVYVRDSKTRNFLKDYWNLHSEYSPDFAFSFPNIDKIKFQVNNLVAINVAPVYSQQWPYKNKFKYDNYINSLSKSFLTYYLNNPECYFWFYHTNYPTDQLGAIDIITKMISLGIPAEKIQHEDKLLTASTIALKLKSCKFAVTTRLHAAILALKFGLPIISIAYQPKVKNILYDLDLAKVVVDISNLKLLHVYLQSIDSESWKFKLTNKKLEQLDQMNVKTIQSILQCIS